MKEREREREKKGKKSVRESGCTLAGSGGLNKVERGGFVPVDARRERRKPIEGAEGRQSSHLALKRRLRALFHSFFPPSSSSSSFVPSFSRLSHSILFDTLSLSLSLSRSVARFAFYSPRSDDSSSILRSTSSAPSHLLSLCLVLFVFARLVNASRPQRTLYTQLFTGRLSSSPSIEGEGLFSSGTKERERERERERENSSSDGETFAIWRPRDGAFLFTRFISASSVVPW